MHVRYKRNEVEEKVHFRYDIPLNNYNFPIYTSKIRVNALKCFSCNHLGDIAKYGHTMRCYACDRFIHKDQYYVTTINC